MALVQHKDQPTAGTGCRRGVLSSAQQHQILSSLCAMKCFYIARISVDCLSPIICLLGVKLQPAVWAPTAHCLSHGNGLSQALCVLLQQRCAPQPMGMLSVCSTFTPRAKVFPWKGFCFQDGVRGCCAAGTGLGWHCLDQPMLPILPMELFVSSGSFQHY